MYILKENEMAADKDGVFRIAADGVEHCQHVWLFS